MAKGKERAVYYRAVRFEVVPTWAQLLLLTQISQNLGLVWNEALMARMVAFEAWKVARENEPGSENGVRIPTLFDQINALTARRAQSSEGDGVGFGSIPRNWQEETLDRLNGSFQSFFALRKKGDPDARTPHERQSGFFQVIPGRSGFGVKNRQIVFAPNLFGKEALAFPVPEYCLRKLGGGKLKKFTLSRDVHDLSKPGRFWVSVVYEVEQPEVAPAKETEQVYVALGASSIGVVSSKGEEVITLWRPDKHWKSKIESVEKRLKDPALTKGSLRSQRLVKARRDMFERMGRQQRQNHREVVVKLLTYGKHFVVTDYVVRSKAGKLADGEAHERSGPQGLNWAAQNTGSFLHLLAHLEEKVKEVGGSVVKYRIVSARPKGIGIGYENKVKMARFLCEEFHRAECVK